MSLWQEMEPRKPQPVAASPYPLWPALSWPHVLLMLWLCGCPTGCWPGSTLAPVAREWGEGGGLLCVPGQVSHSPSHRSPAYGLLRAVEGPGSRWQIGRRWPRSSLRSVKEGHVPSAWRGGRGALGTSCCRPCFSRQPGRLTLQHWGLCSGGWTPALEALLPARLARSLFWSSRSPPIQGLTVLPAAGAIQWLGTRCPFPCFCIFYPGPVLPAAHPVPAEPGEADASAGRDPTDVV